MIEIDKSKFLDSEGRPLTQSIFLEVGYNDYAIYTLKENDHEYNGKIYPSLKKLYLEMEDPTEYFFASRYLLGWKHWSRLKQNKVLKPHFEEWAEELEVKIRAQAIRDIISCSASEQGGFQAAKWLADRGWDKKAVGRPTKADKEREDRIADTIAEQFSADIVRLKNA